LADADLSSGLKILLDDDALRNEFVSLYGECRRSFIATFDPNMRTAARLYLALQTNRLNADLAFLVRGNALGTEPKTLTNDLSRFEHNSEGVGAFIDTTATRGRYLLHDLHGDLPGSFAFEQIEALAHMGGGMFDFALQCLAKLGLNAGTHTRARLFLQNLGLGAAQVAA
jgi:hypothetical protein